MSANVIDKIRKEKEKQKKSKPKNSDSSNSENKQFDNKKNKNNSKSSDTDSGSENNKSKKHNKKNNSDSDSDLESVDMDSKKNTKQNDSKNFDDLKSDNKNQGIQTTFSQRSKTGNAKDKVCGAKGLDNLGNTCYMNSFIQCILNLPALKEYFTHKEFVPVLEKKIHQKILEMFKKRDIKDQQIDKEDILMARDSSLSYQLYRLFEVTYDNDFTHTIKPVSFRNSFVSKNQKFDNFNQQDAHEALLFFLDTIHEELSKDVKVVKNNPSEEILKMEKKSEKCSDTIKDKSKSKKKKEKALLKYREYTMKHMNTYIIFQSYRFWSKDIKANKYSIITKLFTGITHVMLKCPMCNYMSNTFETFRDYSVAIPNMRTNVNLYDCFKYHTKVEILNKGEEWHCDNCYQKVRAYKQLTIWEPPQYLIVHLKRFSKVPGSRGYSMKNDAPVDYPVKDFSLAEFMSPLRKDMVYVYDLSGVMCHSGGKDGGHYTAHATKYMDGNKWYNHNDSTVRGPLDENTVKNDQSAYVLVYTQKQSLNR